MASLLALLFFGVYGIDRLRHDSWAYFARAQIFLGRGFPVAIAERSLIHRFSAALVLDPVLERVGPGFMLSKVVGGYESGRMRLPLSTPTVRRALFCGWLDARSGEHDDNRVADWDCGERRTT